MDIDRILQSVFAPLGMVFLRRKIPVLVPIQINIVDVRDVAEAHVRALTMGQNAGLYLSVSGDMQFSEISKTLREEYPELNTPRFTIPYILESLQMVRRNVRNH